MSSKEWNPTEEVTPILEVYPFQWLDRLKEFKEEKEAEKPDDVGILITDRDACILWVNETFSSLTGYQPWEVTGRNPRIFQSGYHDRKFYENMWGTLRRTGKWKGEIWDMWKDNTLHPVYLMITAIKDDKGNTVLYVGMVRELVKPLKSIDYRMLIPQLKSEECSAMV